MTTALHPPTASERHRFHLLDLLRGVAAVFVLFWHLPAFIAPQNGRNTYLAVDFFFCLSGFVIAFSYERRIGVLLSLRDFLVARIIRLYPLFCLSIVCGLALFLRFDIHQFSPPLSPGRWILSLGFQILMIPDYVTKISPDSFAYNPAAWSLAFELIANIAFGVLVFLRLNRTSVLLLIAAGSLLALLYGSPASAHFDVGALSIPLHFVLGCSRVAVSFFLGVALLRLHFASGQFIHAPAAQVTLAIALTVFLTLLLRSRAPILQHDLSRIATILIAFPLIIFLGAQVRLSGKLVPLCAFLGDTSYPVYLFHTPILHVLARLFAHKAVLLPTGLSISNSAATLFLFLSIALTLALSYAVLRLYDIPVRKQLMRAYIEVQNEIQ